MPKVICYVTEVNLYHNLPVLDNGLKVAGTSISEYFRLASLQNSGDPAIDLTIDWSRKDIVPPSPDYGMDDGQLQHALELLLNTAVSKDTAQVGLILANFYSQASSAYGYMFDLNFHTSMLGPRQGCAVFLGQIHNATGSDEKSFRDRVVFTAIHEIGHLFNLWHVDNPASFMKPPPNDDLLNSCSFVSDHERYLQFAADPTVASFVLPGKSASDFDTRVPGQDYPSGGDSFYLPENAPDITVKIGLSHQRFWHFEPVELDVEVSLSDPAAGAISIPDEIDPGYARFEVWITRPDGELHRYRPARRFCANPEKRQISHDKPFRRDISIFRQSGGYTFVKVGRYQIQVRLQLSPDRQIISNYVECEVLKAQPESNDYTAIQDALSSVDAAKFLCYHSHLPARADLARMRHFAEVCHASPSGAAVNYLLGRVFLKAAAATCDADRALDLRNHAQHHFTKIADHPLLSTHRSAIVKGLLASAQHTTS
jgi:predicted Zn-dependent protease